MRRSALILLVAGIFGVLLFLATRPNDSRVRAPALERDAGPVETRRELGAARALAPSSDRTVVSPPEGQVPSEVDESVGWRVCVVDARTNAAVAGATVSVIDFGAIGRELAARGIGFDTIAGLRMRREQAVEAQTGADGCTRFSAPPRHAAVEARSGADWAFTVVNQVPEDGCVTLKLAPDRALLVRVVDAAGSAAGGVPAALRRQVDARPTFTWKWTDTEAGSGLATFLHFQRRLEQGSGWHALLAFPVRDQTVVPVDEHTPLDPPVTLVLPDTGRVRVRVRAADGSVPDLEGIDLRLDAFDRGTGGSRVWPDGPWARPHLDAQGEALVPWIGLGLEVRAALVREAEDELVVRSIAGPSRPGEEVVCALEWSRSGPHDVTGRFVFRDGRAWPATKVSAFATIFPTRPISPPVRDVEVASDGRFRMTVHEERPADGTRAFRFSVLHPDGQGEVIALVALDQEVPPEGLDLGDVLLDYGELLVSGRVVDEALRPITGASLAVRRRTLASGTEFWPRIPHAGTVRTAEDGTFALHLPPGEAPPGEDLRLEASAQGFVADPGRDVRRGDRNVEVVLTRAGALAGSLDLDRDLGIDDVSVFVAGTARQLVQLRPDAMFEIHELVPGTYSLDVRRRGANGQFEREPAARVSGLLVRAGEVCRDPRIQALRIESVLETLRIRVVDRASTPLKGAAISVVGLADARAAISKDDGVSLVRCEALPVDLEVSAFGYVRQRLENVSTDRVVVLDAGFPIRLRASARPSGGKPKYMLGAMLHCVDANGLRRGLAWGPEFATDYASERSHFDEHGELALRMPAAGTYECDVRVTVLGDDHVGRGATVVLPRNPRITVLASGEEQVFELSIPQDAVQAAVERALR